MSADSFLQTFTPEISDMQQRSSPFQFRPATYHTGVVSSNGENLPLRFGFCFVCCFFFKYKAFQNILMKFNSNKCKIKFKNESDFVFFFCLIDESSGKEEPSSTVEEIETKCYNEAGSEEVQRETEDGMRHRMRME